MTPAVIDVIDHQPGHRRDVAVPGPDGVVRVTVAARPLEHRRRRRRHGHRRAQRPPRIRRRIRPRRPDELNPEHRDQPGDDRIPNQLRHALGIISGGAVRDARSVRAGPRSHRVDARAARLGARGSGLGLTTSDSRLPTPDSRLPTPDSPPTSPSSTSATRTHRRGRARSTSGRSPAVAAQHAPRA